jgi:SAM-dependent methyltransferase
MVEPIVQGRTEVVIGSRMMRPGSARAGGMPLYKYVGNRVLSAVQSRFTGLELSEWHSGYRAYAVRALRQVDFESNSNGFDFDTEITLQLHSAGCRFEEIAIPTFYGNEVCHVDGVRYAADVLLDTARFTRDRAGLGSGRFAQEPQRFDPLDDPNGTHSTIAAWAAGRPPTHVLDLGCPNGHLRELMEKAGHRVTAVSAATTNDPFDASDGGTENGSGRDISELTGIGDEHFGLVICRQPTAGRPREQWLEHLREVRWRLEPGGRVIVDTPVRARHEKPSSLLTVTELRRTVSAAGMEISRIAVPEPAAADAALGGPLRATRAMWPELRPRSAARHVVAELRSVV